MADRSEKHTCNHHGSKDEIGHGKPVNCVQAKTITNIYYDCLERIFDFLDLESLLNVAGTCKRLQIAAAKKFGDEYGEKKVRIDCMGGYPPILRIEQNQIIFGGLKFCLPFLRCFGAKISNLEMRYFGNDYVNRYVNEYCADTLTSFSLFCNWVVPVQAFRKPYKNVKHVELPRCDLEKELPNFPNWFPSLQRLSMVICFIDPSESGVYFPHLEHLSLLCHGQASSLINLLEANRQIQTLEFDTPYPTQFSALLNIIDGNRSILKLMISVGSLDTLLKDVTMIELNRFAAERPSVVHLALKGSRFTADNVINFMRQLNDLKSFQFRVKDKVECDRLLGQLDKEWQHQIEAINNHLIALKLH